MVEMDKNPEGMCEEEENVDTEEENTEDEESLAFEVAIEGDGDCFYSSIVEAFRREGKSLELESTTKSPVTGVKCLRLCVASAVTPETFEVLQQHQQVVKMFFGCPDNVFLFDQPRQGWRTSTTWRP